MEENGLVAVTLDRKTRVVDAVRIQAGLLPVVGRAAHAVKGDVQGTPGRNRPQGHIHTIFEVTLGAGINTDAASLDQLVWCERRQVALD